MMVNADVDGYTKALNHRKTPKNVKKNNILKTKRILKPNYKFSGGPVFTFTSPGGRGNSRLFPTVSYATECETVSLTNAPE